MASFAAIPQTPVGSSAVGAALGTILGNLLPLWPAYNHAIPTGGQAAITAGLALILGYLAGYLKVQRAPGQEVRMSLTSTPLPTVEQIPLTSSIPEEALQAEHPELGVPA